MEKEIEKELDDFIVAQYNQTWECMRTYLRLSWQIPAFTMVAIAALLTTAPSNLASWEKEPLISGIAFLVVAFSILVLFIHHRRNQLFVKEYGRVLREIESKYGLQIETHHSQMAKRLKGFNRISSTSMLVYFLGLLAVLAFSVSLYFFAIALNILK